MKYKSTRGNGGSINFAGTVLAGLAPDGGLYVPEEVPRFTAEDLRRFQGMSYSRLAFEILKVLAPDIDKVKLWKAIRRSYNAEVFKNVNDGDTASDIVPVHKLGLGADIYLARLSNGPTLAFKDLGLQLLGNLFEIVLDGAELNILGATSGDTGSAAIHAMLGRKGIHVFMLSPRFGMSEFQSAQMWGVNDPTIHNLAIRGSFDNCQDVVKAINADEKFKETYHLGAINSINWARIAAQIVYYFWSYLRVCGDRTTEKAIDFAVPTGNFGNIYAAYVAKMMGLPIRRLVLATNENDVLHEFFQTGIYEPREKTVTTSSPSMDITKGSNFERFIYHLLGGDTERVAELWKLLGSAGQFDLSNMMHKIRNSGIVSCSVIQAEAHQTILEVHNRTGVIIDTHTAVAMKAAMFYARTDAPMVVMETAQACKFNSTIEPILNKPAPIPQSMEGTTDSELLFTEMDPDPETVKAFIREKC